MEGSLTTYVGVDVAKQAFDVHTLPHDARFSMANDQQGIQAFLQQLPPPGTCLIVVEASGGYQRELVAELLHARHLVSVVNPRQVRNFAKALGILAKTDALDAQVLARFGQLVQPRTTAQNHEKQQSIQELVTRRRQLIDLRTSESNRLETTKLKTVRAGIQKVVALLNHQIKVVEQELLRLVESDDEWRNKLELLKSVPGVGDITGASLISLLPELGNLNRQQIASLAGLAPFNRDSGRFKGSRSIWGGRTNVRGILYMATLTARRCNPVIRTFAQRLQDQGKPFKVIMVACMRKLLVILNTMLKENALWNPKHA